MIMYIFISLRDIVILFLMIHLLQVYLNIYIKTLVCFLLSNFIIYLFIFHFCGLEYMSHRHKIFSEYLSVNNKKILSVNRFKYELKLVPTVCSSGCGVMLWDQGKK